MSEIQFTKRETIKQVEESTDLAPKFDSNGLISVITSDYSSGEVLMQGYMNEEALKKLLMLVKLSIIQEAAIRCGTKVK